MRPIIRVTQIIRDRTFVFHIRAENQRSAKSEVKRFVESGGTPFYEGDYAELSEYWRGHIENDYGIRGWVLLCGHIVSKVGHAQFGQACVRRVCHEGSHLVSNGAS